MIHVRISSAGNPTVILAIREVFEHIIELLFLPWGLLGSSVVAQGGTWGAVSKVTNGMTGMKGFSRRRWCVRGIARCHDESGECGRAGPRRGQFPKGGQQGWVSSLEIGVA